MTDNSHEVKDDMFHMNSDEVIKYISDCLRVRGLKQSEIDFVRRLIELYGAKVYQELGDL